MFISHQKEQTQYQQHKHKNSNLGNSTENKENTRNQTRNCNKNLAIKRRKNMRLEECRRMQLIVTECWEKRQARKIFKQDIRIENKFSMSKQTKSLHKIKDILLYKLTFHKIKNYRMQKWKKCPSVIRSATNILF